MMSVELDIKAALADLRYALPDGAFRDGIVPRRLQRSVRSCPVGSTEGAWLRLRSAEGRHDVFCLTWVSVTLPKPSANFCSIKAATALRVADGAYTHWVWWRGPGQHEVR